MNEQIKSELDKRLCVECMKMYTDFVDKAGNRICSGCDKRKKRETQRLREYIAEFGGSK